MKASSYSALRDFVYRRSGINLGDSKQALVLARVSQRLRALGMTDPDQYIAEVLDSQNESEIVHLLDSISTNFTSFFREIIHFNRLADILKERKASGIKSLRLWCAAASTGEEPYTLSMVCQEALGEGADIKILATDLSTRALDSCRAGLYHRSRLDPVPEPLVKKWFGVPDSEEIFEVKDSLRKPLSFARLNLVETPYPMRGTFDVIFCRNVMIYFDEHGRSGFLGQAHRLLVPGGYLFVGHAESVSATAPGFKPIAPSVYRKVPV